MAYFLSNISAENYRNRFTSIKVIASHACELFLRHSVYCDLVAILRSGTTNFVYAGRLYMGRSDVTESMVTIRSPFCGYNTI